MLTHYTTSSGGKYSIRGREQIDEKAQRHIERLICKASSTFFAVCQLADEYRRQADAKMDTTPHR